MADNFSEGAPSKRDFWDRLDILGKFFSAVVIGMATIAVGSIYHYEEDANRTAENDRADKQHRIDQSVATAQNEYTAKTQRLSVVTTLIPLIKNGGDDKKAALALISYYGDDPVKLQIAGIYPNDTNIMAAASHSLDASASTTLSAVQLQQSGKASNQGWIYLGEYGPEGAPQQSWKTHYLDFDITVAPKALAGKVYRVRDETGALYIRDSSQDLTVRWESQPGAYNPDSMSASDPSPNGSEAVFCGAKSSWWLIRQLSAKPRSSRPRV